jgi:hypothetical protein
MNDQNEVITRKVFFDGMEHLEARIDMKIDALALLTQQEFVAVRGEIKAMEGRLEGLEERIERLEGRMAGVEEKMATKQDLFRVEARILSAIGDIAAEVKNHNVRILALKKIVKP